MPPVTACTVTVNNQISAFFCSLFSTAAYGLQCAVETETAAAASVRTAANVQWKVVEKTSSLLTTQRGATGDGGGSGAAAKGGGKMKFWFEWKILKAQQIFNYWDK